MMGLPLGARASSIQPQQLLPLHPHLVPLFPGHPEGPIQQVPPQTHRGRSQAEGVWRGALSSTADRRARCEFGWAEICKLQLVQPSPKQGQVEVSTYLEGGWLLPQVFREHDRQGAHERSHMHAKGCMIVRFVAPPPFVFDALSVASRSFNRPPPFQVVKLDGWLALMTDARLVDSQFTLSDAMLAFLWSRMHVIDEIKDYPRCARTPARWCMQRLLDESADDIPGHDMERWAASFLAIPAA